VTYGVTLLRDARNREAAIAFLEFMLSPEHGLKLLKEMGQPPFVPCRVPSEAMHELLPQSLRPLVEVVR
jgi:molybdate/tungstate transport system substrate-binding protein